MKDLTGHYLEQISAAKILLRLAHNGGVLATAVITMSCSQSPAQERI